MDREFADILEECLEQIYSGTSLEETLAAFPAYADELRPYLQLAIEISALPLPSPSSDAIENGWQRVAARLRARGYSRSLFGSLGWVISRLNIWTVMKAASICLVVLMAAGTLVVNVSANSLPGDSFYPVKRSWENIRLELATSPNVRSTLQQTFDQEHQQEVQALVKKGRSAVVNFEGPLESKHGDRWQVGKVVVQVNPKTVVKAEPKVGERVGVQAVVVPGGEVRASNIDQVPVTAASPAGTSTPNPPVPNTASPTNITLPSDTPVPSATLEPSSTPTVEPSIDPSQTGDPGTPGVPPQPSQGPNIRPPKPGNRHQTKTPTSTPTGDQIVLPYPTQTGMIFSTEPSSLSTGEPVFFSPPTSTIVPSSTPTLTSTPSLTPTPTNPATEGILLPFGYLPYGLNLQQGVPGFSYLPALRQIVPNNSQP